MAQQPHEPLDFCFGLTPGPKVAHDRKSKVGCQASVRIINLVYLNWNDPFRNEQHWPKILIGSLTCQNFARHDPLSVEA